jgi:hypothetical protein
MFRLFYFLPSIPFELQTIFRNYTFGKNPLNLKKLFSIGLLMIFLFNVGGYYLVFWGLGVHNDKVTWNRLEAGKYSEDETTLLKIPMAMPYPVYNEGYQPFQDEFEHQGNFYKGIKQKLQGDTLYIVCIKDTSKKRLVGTMNKYAKDSNDLPTQEKKQTLSKLLSEYESFYSIEIIHNDGWCRVAKYTLSSLEVINPDLPILSPPPRG